MRLPRSFYDRPTLDVARDLIGQVLVHRRGRTVTSGVIVEVEAYIGESDPACHAARGRTPRNQPLYGPPGIAYVYLNYGLHYLVNAVTEAEGHPAAVLIRALDPLDGVSTMRRRRGQAGSQNGGLSITGLCRGPGNLTAAMGIDLTQNRLDLTRETLFIEKGGRLTGDVVWGPRIGIRVGTDRPWRVWLSGHPAVSGTRSPEPRAKSPKPRAQGL